MPSIRASRLFAPRRPSCPSTALASAFHSGVSAPGRGHCQRRVRVLLASFLGMRRAAARARSVTLSAIRSSIQYRGNWQFERGFMPPVHPDTCHLLNDKFSSFFSCRCHRGCPPDRRGLVGTVPSPADSARRRGCVAPPPATSGQFPAGRTRLSPCAGSPEVPGAQTGLCSIRQIPAPAGSWPNKSTGLETLTPAA